jgi:hypothetical protein
MKKGFHWANKCKSKFDKGENPLPSQQGNGMRGQPSALYPVGTFMVRNIPCSPFPLPPEEVQNWTSVPLQISS